MYITSFALFPIQIQAEILQTVSPTRDKQAPVRTNFFQVGLLGLQCSSKTSAICVVGDVSIRQGIEKQKILSSVRVSSDLTWVYADTASAACPSQSSNIAMTSITFAAVNCDADEPYSVKTA